VALSKCRDIPINDGQMGRFTPSSGGSPLNSKIGILFGYGNKSAINRTAMNSINQQYWFRAKRHGLGWGLPIAWHGWGFFCLWLVAIPFGLHFLTLDNKPLRWTFLGAMIGLLLAVCFSNGDPRGRRWQSGNGT